MALALAACTGETPPAAVEIGGGVTGLEGAGLVLRCSSGGELAVAGDGRFACPARAAPGSPYSVTVATQPTSPSQTCLVSSGEGVVPDTGVSGVLVSCGTNAYRLGGTVLGLAGRGLVLSSGGDQLYVSGDGPFAFGSPVRSGAAYRVAIEAQPSAPWQTCAVAGGSGVVTGGDVLDVAVTCTTNRYLVGGSVAGLAGDGLVLRSGGEQLPIAADGRFSFPTPLASGSSYSVAIQQQPAAPIQACTALRAEGTVAGADVTEVAIDCVTLHAFGGTVTGLTGSGLVLRLEAGSSEDLIVVREGPFRFGALAPPGTAYRVLVQVQPSSPAQLCRVDEASGVVSAADVAVGVTCVTEGPVVTSFDPASGPPGTSVTIAGARLGGATAVRFGAAAAGTFSALSDAQVTAVVPAGATTGPISVTTAAGSASSPASFTVAPATTLDLLVDGAYVTQGSQSYLAAVPLVANRPGLLRVFLRANQASSATPRVDVRLLQGGSTVWTRSIDAPSPVPTQVLEGAASWDLALAPADLTTAADQQLAITVNPADVVAEANYANNTYLLPIAPAAVPTWRVTLVPLVLASGTGDVSQANQASWIDRLRRMYPIAGVDVVVAAPFTPSDPAAPGLITAASDGTGWPQILSDLEAKRVGEGSGRYFFGALHVEYSSGVVGLGYVRGASAIGWDRSGLPDGANYAEVLAHEVGHNFGRLHAPCNNPASVDPSWPTAAAYQGALIGTWGWDASPRPPSPEALKDPAGTHDVMGYCSGVWASDYTYRGIFGYRQASAPAVVAAARPALLVSGTVRGEVVTLRPAFRIVAPPTPAAGAHVLELRDGAGAVLREHAFEPVEAADDPGGARHFTLAVPLDGLEEQRLAELAVSRAGRTLAHLRRAQGPTAPSAPRAVRQAPRATHLTWDRRTHPRAMVRDPATGEVLGFGEGGTMSVDTDLSQLEIHLSDGVTSERHLVVAR